MIDHYIFMKQFQNWLAVQQAECWEILCGITGEEVVRLVTDYYGIQLFDVGFCDFLKEKGYYL